MPGYYGHLTGSRCVGRVPQPGAEGPGRGPAEFWFAWSLDCISSFCVERCLSTCWFTLGFLWIPSYYARTVSNFFISFSAAYHFVRRSVCIPSPRRKVGRNVSGSGWEHCGPVAHPSEREALNVHEGNGGGGGVSLD